MLLFFYSHSSFFGTQPLRLARRVTCTYNLFSSIHLSSYKENTRVISHSGFGQTYRTVYLNNKSCFFQMFKQFNKLKYILPHFNFKLSFHHPHLGQSVQMEQMFLSIHYFRLEMFRNIVFWTILEFSCSSCCSHSWQWSLRPSGSSGQRRGIGYRRIWKKLYFNYHP